MAWWSWLACLGTPQVRSPSSVPAPEAAVVTVVSYREEDLSKVQGRQKFHGYATLDLEDGSEALRAHAADGQLHVNMLRTRLEQAGPVPLHPGTRLQIEAVMQTSTPGYVVLTSFQPTP